MGAMSTTRRLGRADPTTLLGERFPKNLYIPVPLSTRPKKYGPRGQVPARRNVRGRRQRARAGRRSSDLAGKVLRWNGTAWRQVRLPATAGSTECSASRPLAPNDVWVVGRNAPNGYDWGPFGSSSQPRSTAPIGPAWTVGTVLRLGPVRHALETVDGQDHGAFLLSRADPRGLRRPRIFDDNLWPAAESRSGPGSGLLHTAYIRQEIPKLLARVGARSTVECPAATSLGSGTWTSASIGTWEWTSARR